MQTQGGVSKPHHRHPPPRKSWIFPEKPGCPEKAGTLVAEKQGIHPVSVLVVVDFGGPPGDTQGSPPSPAFKNESRPCSGNRIGMPEFEHQSAACQAGWIRSLRPL